MIKYGAILLIVIIGASCASKGDSAQKTVNLEFNGCFHKFKNEAVFVKIPFLMIQDAL